LLPLFNNKALTLSMDVWEKRCFSAERHP